VTYFATNGNDSFVLRAYDDYYFLGGDDFVTSTGAAGNSTVFLGDGNDRYYGRSDTGISGPDAFYGARDLAIGGSGNDYILGKDGDDILCGDFAMFSRQFSGRVGNYYVSSQDTLAWGNDFIDGGDGNDDIVGDGGDDDLRGGNGDDVIWGDNPGERGYPNDIIRGGAGTDEILGGGGDDRIFGNDGNDTLSSITQSSFSGWSDGDDIFSGGDGADIISGGSGSDSINLGINDQDEDSVYFYIGSDLDKINEFEIGIDNIYVYDRGFTSFAQFQATTNWSQHGADTWIIFSNQTDRIVISDVSMSNLSASDFVFIL
jgi:Ca2+-binding RTX toxin-like protein